MRIDRRGLVAGLLAMVVLCCRGIHAQITAVAALVLAQNTERAPKCV